jgi:hypothetical protein
MVRKMLNKLLVLTLLGMAIVGLKTCPTVAAAAEYQAPRVAPIWAIPQGQTYGRWAVEWWQWALGIPAAKNPVADTTGQYCAERQVGNVWFLAGSGGNAPVSRNCNVPAGKSLFFPLINFAYAAFLNDPPETRTEEYVRSAGKCTVPVKLSVTIDGVRIFNPLRFFTGSSGSASPLFNVQLPPNNVGGYDETTVPELVFSPTAEQGYYLFVYPLAPGEHTIHWTASGCTEGQTQDITYHLNVGSSTP